MADKHSPIYMKAAIVFLILASLGLGVGLMMRHKQAVEVSRQDEAKIAELSKNVVDTNLLNKFRNVRHENHCSLVLVECFCNYR